MSKRKKCAKDSNMSINKSSSPNSQIKPPNGLTIDQVTVDAFQNLLARLGTGSQNILEGTDYPMTRLTKDYQLLNSLYRSHWIIGRIIDCIPQDMCKNWIKLQTQMDPENLKRFDSLQRTTRIKRDILLGLKWGRLYGGAGAVIIIDGHEDILDQPLDYDTIMPGSFKGLIVADRWSGITPGAEYIDDVNSPEFGLPEYYEWFSDNQSIRVHHSRILRFIGRELPYWEKYAETGWGASEVERVFDELKKRDNTSWNIAQLVFLANLRVLKMSDLAETLAVGNEKAQARLYNTLEAQNWLMSNMGMYILSEKDGFETHQYTFAGLNDIYESFMMDISGAAEIPVTKLFGRSPAGMNATGESDMQNYYDTVEQNQTSHLEPVFDKLLPIMFMSEFGAVPDDLDYTFNPVRTPSDDEVADLVGKKVTAINDVFNSGIISQKVALKELKQMSDTTGMFTNISDEDIDNADYSTGLAGEYMGNQSNSLNFSEPSAKLPMADGDFKESEHPRKKNGQFAQKGEGDSSSSENNANERDSNKKNNSANKKNSGESVSNKENNNTNKVNSRKIALNKENRGIIKERANHVNKGAAKAPKISDIISDIKTKSPEQLMKEGWEDITDPRKAQNTTSRDYFDPKTGTKISFDKGVEGETGFEGVDHYHVHNPDYTNKKVDYYFDADGNPVGKGSKASHIVIEVGD